MTIGLARGAQFSDTYQGIHLEWNFESSNSTNEDQNHSATEDPYYEEEEEEEEEDSDSDNDIGGGSRPRTHFALSFNKEHKGQVLQSYFSLVIETSRDILSREKDLMIHDAVRMFEDGKDDDDESTCNPDSSFKISHPFTFDNLAMDPVKKKMIIDDLDRFVRRKGFYKDVGRPWKRGYLLYGPPGTGKSSLVVAMANYLKFDIYDLQLTRFYACWRSGEYAELLKMIPSRSIILVEDIDHQGQAFPYDEEYYEGYDNEGDEEDGDEEENESDEGDEQDDDVEGENEGDEHDGVEEDNESGEGDEQDDVEGNSESGEGDEQGDVEGNNESGEGDEQDEDESYYDEDEEYYNQNQGYYEKV